MRSTKSPALRSDSIPMLILCFLAIDRQDFTAATNCFLSKEVFRDPLSKMGISILRAPISEEYLISFFRTLILSAIIFLSFLKNGLLIKKSAQIWFTLTPDFLISFFILRRPVADQRGFSLYLSKSKINSISSNPSLAT